MITHDRTSNTYLVACDECGHRVHARGTNGFDIARQAHAAGWTIGLRDRCRDCPPATPDPRRARRG